MKIIRNKFLTRIIGHNIELKLTTQKFDDLMGIIDGKLPETRRDISDIDFEKKSNKDENLPSSIFKSGEYVISLNDKVMFMNELMEFADINYELFSKIIDQATIKFINDEYFKELSSIHLAEILIKISTNVSDPKEFLNRYGTYNANYFERSIGNLLIPDKKYLNPNIFYPKNFLVIAGCHKPFSLDCVQENMLADIVKTLGNLYDSITEKEEFYDCDGNKYVFPSITHELPNIIKSFIYEEFFCNINDLLKLFFLDRRNINNIILRTDTWKHCGVGIITLMKVGQNQKVPVSISSLLSKEIFLSLQESPLMTKMICTTNVKKIEETPW
jgi:hypothetical protein